MKKCLFGLLALVLGMGFTAMPAEACVELCNGPECDFYAGPTGLSCYMSPRWCLDIPCGLAAATSEELDSFLSLLTSGSEEDIVRAAKALPFGVRVTSADEQRLVIFESLDKSSTQIANCRGESSPSADVTGDGATPTAAAVSHQPN